MPTTDQSASDTDLVVGVDDAKLLAATRQIGRGEQVTDEVSRQILERVGLCDTEGLTDAGQALYKLAFVAADKAQAVAALGERVRVLLAFQVLEQELAGFGAVSAEAVLDLLALHRAIPADLDVAGVRSVLRVSNKLGLLRYSQRDNTIKVRTAAADAPLAGEIAQLAAIISPRTPHSNVVRLRRVIRGLTGTIWWTDPHFGHRALEELLEVDVERVDRIHLLSGDAQNVVTSKASSEFKRFEAEMTLRGVAAEWRVDPQASRDWHDRWLIGDEVTYNIPPVNTLFKGDYSEILPTKNRPPVESWWARSSAPS